MANIQALAFYDPMPIGPLNELFSSSFQARPRPAFLCELHCERGTNASPAQRAPLNKPTTVQAEVLAGLKEKLKYSPQEGFVCLVAENATNPQGITGVVEISLQAQKVGAFHASRHMEMPAFLHAVPSI